ncbi:mediator of RNA polymerase II transcription subunit 15a-like [Rosa rugosa]|uniref:mediator of RNA polymerase II transcription subunit 15a-like n=1 Tax=Rosa rugosa TaxID=74645 RepID=UPI002B41137D|nr:mediator of RNA polymerase II transcription subunit 15a-like [Rosa rugosa]
MKVENQSSSPLPFWSRNRQIHYYLGNPVKEKTIYIAAGKPISAIPPPAETLNNLSCMQLPFSDLQQNHQMSPFQQTSQSAINNHPQTGFRQINSSQHAPYIHQNASSIPQSLLMQSQKHVVMRRRLAATTLQQNQSTCLDFPQQQHINTYQLNDAQQQLHRQNLNLSGPHHEQLSQRNIISIQQQTLERQLNSSQVEKMQRQQNRVEQDEQQTHQMAGMPASTLLMEGEVYRKVQMLKRKYERPLKVIFQRFTYCLQNLDRHSINKLEVVNSLYQTVKSILRMLNVPERDTMPTTKEKLGLLEKKIEDILHPCGNQQRQLVQIIDSRTLQAQTNQEEKKPPTQTVNIECFATKMQQSNVTNLMMNDSQPLIEKHGRKHLPRNLTRKDSDQASSSGYLTMPTSSPQQQNVMTLLSQNPIQSNVNNLESRFSVPRYVHLTQSKEQQDVQTQKPKQQLLQENHRLVKLQSEAFPNPLREDHNSSSQQVPKHTCQSEKINLPMHLTKVSSPFNSPSRISSLAPKASSPMSVDSEKPKSDTLSNSNAGNIGDEQVKGATEAPSLSTPLLEKSNDDICSNKSTVDSDAVQPIHQLINVVNSMSSKAPSASASVIASVACTTDRMKMKRPRSTLPIIDADSESGICHMMKRPRLEVNQTLLEEIRAINKRLIDTVLDISDQETAPSVKDGERTIVRCSFVGVAISPNLMSSPMFPLQPLRLLVPANYPFSSPIFLDKLTVQVKDELEDLSAKVMSKLSHSLQTLAEPLSLGEIARVWDTCTRAVVCEYAQQSGGGSFSSKYGTWEDFLTVP